MTCEVAVMNRRGVALAADSAVTLGDGAKIYNTAEKLFSIADDIPVGIMTYGAADLMRVPWETLIKMYARRLGSRRLPTLEAYALDLIAFIEDSGPLFSHEAQRDSVVGDINYVWNGYMRRVGREIGDEDASEKRLLSVLNDVISDDHSFFVKYDDNLGASYATAIQKAYAANIEEIQNHIFEDIRLPAKTVAALRKTVAYMFSKKWVLPATTGSVVVAGMGEDEPFPGLIDYGIAGYALGKLRWIEQNRASLAGETDACIVPFAQRDTIETIINGVHPHFVEWLSDEIEEVLEYHPKAPGPLRKRIAGIKDRASEFFSGHYEHPLMEAVTGLPRHDLAKMAESLVSVTAFVMRMSFDQHETVSEPIDVALLSKGDGFTWVKRKTLVQAATLA